MFGTQFHMLLQMQVFSLFMMGSSFFFFFLKSPFSSVNQVYQDGKRYLALVHGTHEVKVTAGNDCIRLFPRLLSSGWGRAQVGGKGQHPVSVNLSSARSAQAV